MSFSPARKKKMKTSDTQPTVLEPANPGLGGRRVIHYATETGVDNTKVTTQ